MDSLQSLYNQTVFLLSNLTWFGMIDLALVTAAFYLILSLIRRSAIGYMMREILLLGLALFVLTTLLPLPVFDWLVRGILVATLVATPIIFQAQLRRFLERVGRTSGLAQAVRESAAERVIPELTHAVENMVDSKTGALIVLEGNDSLEEIVKTGVSFGGRVTSEVLESIFYNGTPLHDGAILVQGDKITAAACVLPLTDHLPPAEKRLGTRHRAAVGISETSDALVIVVSEETGQLGVAQQGHLHRPLSSLELREKLLDFYGSSTSPTKPLSLWSLLSNLVGQIWYPNSGFSFRKLFSDLGLLVVAVLLSLVVWSFVIEQTNPFQLARVEGIALRIENQPPNTRIIPPPPETVSAVIQTTTDLLPTLRPGTFQATATLARTTPGLYRVPIEVKSSVNQVLVVSVEPQALDLELAPIISRTVPIMVTIPDQQNLPTAYELVGVPTAVPGEVQIVGPAPIVEKVEQVETSISLANATTSIRETRPLRVVDERGHEVFGVEVQPNQTQVNANIRPRLNAREVSVQANVNGQPPQGYQLSNLSVTPANVTLQGSIDQLADIGSVITTLPVDVSQATGDFEVQIPLDLPPNLQALDSNGVPARNVKVSVGITPRTGNLAISRPIEIIGSTRNLTITVEPRRVDLLLSGAQPLLNEIQSNPDLVHVTLDASGLRRGQQVNMTPNFVAPAGIEAQFVPASVLVTVE
ncbi:MAG TPA: diadenylate cyclase CdaA [Anaerolineae bacterium]|nr:diadenylate cyclase CdaA [Anaerolineae bacterium]MCB0181011.1 diadenylate cyclase CdaA [Anaerolineae bacterium]MCB0222995.1 diadenylate cyclase CdaA [Anaerolineae bacterium]MCB9107729.1 TIGR00159 family protein [Anaerolineales bacterium]HRV90609.1 diadenylate cyclase CdaA [Anaerolineae bacterium]